MVDGFPGKGRRVFVPCHYREPDRSWTVDLVRDNPLAALVSNGAETDAPHATHVPIILDPLTAGQPPTELDGGTLWGHMNRANPHWRALTCGTPVTAIFTGPHAYVSPALYQTTPAAPTWNFTAVHIRGVLRKIEADTAGDETLATVAATVRAFEKQFGAGWCMSGSIGYFRRLVPAVGAFRIAVTHVDGMFKLSQEQKPDVRQRVQRSFAERESAGHRGVAALMSQLPRS
jgi:transcriptional regulator